MKNDKSNGCLWWIGNGVFALGCLLLLSVTVDLMTAYAPTQVFGYTGLEGLYGFGVGMALEGTLILMKIGIGKPSNVIEWIWDVILMGVPLAVSALAQIVHGFIVNNTLAQQPAEIQWLISWLVPNIPTLIVFLWLVRGLLETMPPQLLRSMGIVEYEANLPHSGQG